MQTSQHHPMSPNMKQCIQNCLDCHRLCTHTTQHCLEMGGAHAEASHVRTMQDCAQACITCADFMLRISPLHPRYCGICADACQKCAEECERLGGNDETMKECAMACRKCEESCREMSAAVS